MDKVRLIDANALETTLLRETAWFDNADEGVAYEAVHAAPTVDAEPVRHGRWIGMFKGRAKCSECKTEQEVYTFVGNVTQEWCARCGARMSEKEDA